MRYLRSTKLARAIDELIALVSNKVNRILVKDRKRAFFPFESAIEDNQRRLSNG